MNVMQRTLLLQREAETRRREAQLEARSKALDARDRELDERARQFRASHERYEFWSLTESVTRAAFYERVSLDDGAKIARVRADGMTGASGEALHVLAPETIVIDEFLKLLRGAISVSADPNEKLPMMIIWEICSTSGSEMHLAQVINRIRFAYPRCKFFDPAGVEV